MPQITRFSSAPALQDQPSALNGLGVLQDTLEDSPQPHVGFHTPHSSPSGSSQSSPTGPAGAMCFKPKLRVPLMDDPNGQQENHVGKTENDVAGKSEQSTDGKPELKTAEDHEDAAFAALRRPAAAGAPAAGATKLNAKRTGPKTKPAKRPAAKTGPTKSKKLQIGCKKCRGNGCSTCMNPAFGGWRGNHAQWCKLGLKHHH